MRFRRVIVAGSAVALVGFAAACGTAMSGSSSGSTSGAATTTGRPTTTAGQPSTATDAAVRAELTMQGSDKPGVGLLTVTNDGSAPVTVRGWPRPTFTDLSGAPAEIPVEQVAVPGEGPSITLEPGRTAFAGVALSTGDDGTAIDTMAVEVPGAGTARVTFVGTDGRPVTDPSRLKVSGVRVGTLQPAAQGVLVF
ncbi:DUF4232 domain-containing protein [Actinosynnema sp. NPDC020468]|uniref:DUF4232 domain-containing protein n=1 Tax=Actinosynnema sp. NPDC020468 TaxID=3154488 RepID=UPI0033E39570